jgi:hypothetical protein
LDLRQGKLIYPTVILQSDGMLVDRFRDPDHIRAMREDSVFSHDSKLTVDSAARIKSHGGMAATD